MRALPRLLLALAIAQAAPLAAPSAAHAQQARPQKLGEYQSWIAATYSEGGQKVCYAFTRASRQGVMLTVTHRPGRRDTVTVSAGYAYPRNAEAVAVIGGSDLPFYTAGSTAAARDGAMVVQAMRNGREMLVRGPGANGRGTTSDTFPLAGFSAAYDAISKECPAGGRR
jgi:invasion protein IalB